MIQFIGYHRILVRQYRLEQTAIRVEAGGIEDRVLGPEKLADFSLELFVYLLRPADEANGRQSVTPLLKSGLRGFDDLRIIGQSEIVVRAHVENLAAIDLDPSFLRRLDHALGFVETCFADLIERLL